MVRREVFSFKIRADLKKEFKKLLKEKGFSTCFILETLLTAWIEGLKSPAHAKVDSLNAVVINQKIEYNVARARRVQRRGDMVGKAVHGFRRDQWYDVDVHGVVHECNCYDPTIGWFYKADV